MSIPMQVDLVSRLPSLSLSPTPQRGLTSFDHDLMPVRLGASLHTFSEPLSSSTGQLCFNLFNLSSCTKKTNAKILSIGYTHFQRPERLSKLGGDHRIQAIRGGELIYN